MIPHASTRIPDWRAARARAGRMLLALDFDGTLAPIVPRPDDAALPPAARRAIERLARDERMLLAIVSGRGLADARGRVPIDGVYFAGNHGLEIEGPGVSHMHDEARAARPLLERCLARIHESVGREPGVFVEDKGLTLSVHFRRVEDAERATALARRTVELCGAEPGVRCTTGKKVVEIRPDVDWDKGRATRFLMATLLDDAANAPVLFIGDDRTDEDAFRAVAGHGEGVVVGDPPPAETAASSSVRSPEEVVALLDALADPEIA
jgi:trehalose-phosphatase